MSAARADQPIGMSSVSLAFGPVDRRLFGHYHAPAGAPRSCGVVLCNPLGWEGLVTHGTYRALADALSRAGFAVLRFDYDGTGDSLGTDEDPDRLQAWLVSIDAAVEELRTQSRVSEVGLFGLSIGATLAAYAAAARRDIASLALWAPTLEGRQYVRALRAYRALNPNGDRLPPGAEEAGGFLFTASTVQSLLTLDLSTLPAPCPRILLLHRNQQSSMWTLGRRWKASGVRVDSTAGDIYGSMGHDGIRPVVPTAVIEEIVRWMSTTHATDVAPSPTRPCRATTTLGGLDVDEEICRFGPDGTLFGILSRPARERSTGPAVLFLNAAFDHRVGPHRMYVPLARAVAGRGFPAMRFDFIDVGDSAKFGDRTWEQIDWNARQQDVRAALDFLESRGVASRFVLMGLCSGAHVAVQASWRDARVIGAVLINPRIPVRRAGMRDREVRALAHTMRYSRQALRRRDTWQRLAGGEIDIVGVATGLFRRAARVAWLSAFFRQPPADPSALRLSVALEAPLARGAELLIVFGEGDDGIEELEAQLGRRGTALRRRPGFRVEIVKGADHAFSQTRDRRQLSALVLEHLERRFL